MGYLTLYKITYSERSEEIIKYAYRLSFEAIKNDTFYYNDEDYTKWFHYERDMLYLSKTFPGILITVKGHGEELKDTWIQYFKDGKCTPRTRAIISIQFDEFNENHLK